MQSTRQRLLEYLEKQRAANAAELSLALQVTQADVRHHLGKLQREGLVVRVESGPQRAAGAGRRGRPASRYSLSKQRLGDNLEVLASALLDQAIEALPPADQRQALKRLATRLAGLIPSGKRLTQRLNAVVQQLNTMRYQARWEAHAAAPRLYLGHCPYAAILPEHPELCTLDSALLEVMLGIPSEQAAKLAQDGRGGTYCLFMVVGASQASTD